MKSPPLPQVLSGEQVNLTTSCSISSVLTQLAPPPPPPPPPPPRPVKPLSLSQPPALAPVSQQDGAQGLLGNSVGFRSSLTQSQECRGDATSSCSRFSFSFSYSLGYHSASSLTSSSSSSSLPLFQPASSLTYPFSSFSVPSPPSPPPPPSQTPVLPAPTLVPIFKNKCPSRHINVALLRLQKQKEQLGGRGDEGGRVTLPALKMKTPSTSSSSSSVSSLPAVRLPFPPPRLIPRFNRHSKPSCSAAPPSAGLPKLNHTSSLSPSPRSKPELISTPEIKSKSSHKVRFNSESKTAANSGHEVKERRRKPLTSSDNSNDDSSTSETAVSRVSLTVKD